MKKAYESLKLKRYGTVEQITLRRWGPRRDLRGRRPRRSIDQRTGS